MSRSADSFARAVKKVQTGKHWKRPDAEAVLDRLANSGLSVAEFVRKNGLPEKRVHWWKKRLGYELPKQGDAPRFVSVEVVQAEQTHALPHRVACSSADQFASSLEVVLHNGRVVRVPTGFDPLTLSQVVAALEATPC